MYPLFPNLIPLRPLFPLFPLSAVSVVSYSAKTQLGKGRGAQWEDREEREEWEERGEIRKIGRRLGMDRVRAQLMFPLFPNLFPLFRSPWFRWFRIPPQTQLGKGRGAQLGDRGEWQEWEE